MTAGNENVSVHRIRLRGPWTIQPLGRLVCDDAGTWLATDSLPTGGRLTMPADWAAMLGADFRGRVRFARHFHRPTGLGAGDRVWLVVEHVQAFATMRLNGEVIGAVASNQCPGRWDITRQLLPRNELAIDVESPQLNETHGMRELAPLSVLSNSSAGGLTGEVRLEIEPATG